MAIRQIFKTRCGHCGEEAESHVLDMTETNVIIIDLYVDGMELECKCGETTYIEVVKH